MDGNNNTENNEDTYEITFRNGALAKLKALARQYNVPEDDLQLIVEKGIKVLELPDDGKLTFKKGGNSYEVDLGNI